MDRNQVKAWVTTAQERLIEPLSFIAPLATRITLGLGFVQTGNGKLHNLERTTQFFASLGIPAPGLNALFIGSLELVGGAALVIGLLTRPFAALLTSTMVVALLTADRSSFLESWTQASDKSPTDIAAFVFLLLLLWLVFLGPGKASVDEFIVRRLARSSEPTGTPHPAAGR